MLRILQFGVILGAIGRPVVGRLPSAVPSSGAIVAEPAIESAPNHNGTATAIADAGDTPIDRDYLVDQIVTTLGPAIFRTALAVLHDRSAAEDVVQETIVRAWSKIHTLNEPAALKGWVLRIAHNIAVSQVRRGRTTATAPSELPERDDSLPTDVGLEQRSAVDDLWRAMDTLDPLSRSIVVLREVEGLSYDEIARIVDTPLATVKTRLFRARRQLADRLEAWR